MKRNFKSHKITSDKRVVHKPSRYILGPRYVQVLQLIITHRPVFDDNAASPTAAQKPKNTKKLAITARKPKNSKPGGIKKKITPPDCLRLWLRVIPTCTEVDAVYFSKRVLGEGKTAQAVSFYIPSLRLTHPQFSDPTKKFTNTSLRKYHNDALSEAGAPIIVQQESLAQNTKAYAKKATHLANKDKVAEIVSGARTTWHSPSPKKVLLPKKSCAIPTSSLP